MLISLSYKVDMAKPGLPDEMVVQGYKDDPELVTLYVGAAKTPFLLPLKHLEAVPFFQKAFSGRFVEAKSRTMEMPEDNPDAFCIFIRWLYRGIAEPDKVIASIEIWTQLLLMADKWCLDELTLKVFKHTHNIAYGLIEGKYAKKSKGWKSIARGYDIASNHAFRFLFVHAVWVEQQGYFVSSKVRASMSESPGFYANYFHWSEVLEEVMYSVDNPYVYQTYSNCLEKNAHSADRFALSILFRAIDFSPDSDNVTSACKELGQARDQFLKQLEI